FGFVVLSFFIPRLTLIEKIFQFFSSAGFFQTEFFLSPKAVKSIQRKIEMTSNLGLAPPNENKDSEPDVDDDETDDQVSGTSESGEDDYQSDEENDDGADGENVNGKHFSTTFC